ncbi:MAG: hypothetical protein KAJ97_05775, partial [Acidobacteria bacterium]|nr:hypothetical protein [Acidobacteriota bacterium]
TVWSCGFDPHLRHQLQFGAATLRSTARIAVREGVEVCEVVWQEKHEDEVECFADFLRTLDYEFGPSTSRYSPKRIVVRVEPGDKYEG